MTEAIETNNYCRILEWDTEFFKRRIARAMVEQLRPRTAKSILRWCVENHIECLYFLADSTDVQTSQLANKLDFNFVDIRVTLNVHHDPNEYPGNIYLPLILRTSRSEDTSLLREIARDSFQLTRFYFDSNFLREDCDALYQTWIEKSCNGYADAVIVSELYGRVVGFITCSLDCKDKGRIGLVGVDKNFRGKGVGSALVSSALEWFGNRSIQEVCVVTQGRNIAALKIYGTNGFLISSVQIWYHKWFSRNR